MWWWWAVVCTFLSGAAVFLVGGCVVVGAGGGGGGGGVGGGEEHLLSERLGRTLSPVSRIFGVARHLLRCAASSDGHRQLNCQPNRSLVGDAGAAAGAGVAAVNGLHCVRRRVGGVTLRQGEAHAVIHGRVEVCARVILLADSRRAQRGVDGGGGGGGCCCCGDKWRGRREPASGNIEDRESPRVGGRGEGGNGIGGG